MSWILREDLRGLIRTPTYARQLIRFEGLRHGNITPTDIDLFVEVRDRCYILGEFKFEGADLPVGQRLALERLAVRVGPQAILFVAVHSGPGDIIAADCLVSEVFRADAMPSSEWVPAAAWRWRPALGLSVAGLFERWIEHCEAAPQSRPFPEG